jgi:formylglycine-generating enzyme required for sulfatase activity
MAHDVFISHSSKDKTRADATCAYLESQGIRCFIAPRDIVPGANWGASITRAIRSSRVMILILSSNANASSQVGREVERAVNAGVAVLPMRIENVMPGEDIDFFLGAPHWLDAFDPPLEMHLAALARAVENILELPPNAPVQEEIPETVAETEPASAPVPRAISVGPAYVVAPPRAANSWMPVVMLLLFLLATGVVLGWYLGIERPAEENRLREAELDRQATIQKANDEVAQAQAQAQAQAAETARLQAEAQKSAAEAEQAKEAADLARAQSDQRATDAAAATEAAAVEKAKQDALAAQAAAELKAKQDALAAQAQADQRLRLAAAAASAPISPQVSSLFPKEGQDWHNSLGMKFSPAGSPGILFGTCDVRIQDYRPFIDATGRAWQKPDFSQEEDHPAVYITWDDAIAYCQWLTAKELNNGHLAPNQSYRLPTDAEWSIAVGVDEPAGGTPESKNCVVRNVYPWGTDFPPPTNGGNYNRQGDGSPDSPFSVVPGTDGYAYTSPVGSFQANRYGLYDMGGNVWQWCEDWYNEEQKYRVLRGGAWDIRSADSFLSSCRYNKALPDQSDADVGFRCVVVAGSN